MKISDVPKILKASHLVQDSVIMSGVHGIGKTEVVKQFARENNMHCVVLIGNILEPQDIAGMPYIKDNSTYFAEPHWLTELKIAASEGRHTILFMDEISRSPLDVRNACMSLILDKEINGHKLPFTEGLQTLVVAAMNPGDSKHNYQVDSLDPALTDRFCFLDVEIDVASWLEWARENNINKIVREFISNNTQKLHFTPKSGVGSTPRSWVMLSKYIDIIDTIDPSVRFSIIEGKVGTSVGAEFSIFLDNYISVVKVQDIEDFIAGKVVDEYNIKDHARELKETLLSDIEPISQMELGSQLWVKYLSENINPTTNNITPLLVFLYSMNMETRIAFLRSKRDNDSTSYMLLARLDFNKQLFITSITT